MLRCMKAFIALTSCLLATVADAQTIYKYRDADGRTLYSNEPLRDVVPVEAIEHRYVPPAAPKAAEAKAGIALDAKLKLRVAALDRAWIEVKDATAALEAVEARDADVAVKRARLERAQAEYNKLR